MNPARRLVFTALAVALPLLLLEGASRLLLAASPAARAFSQRTNAYKVPDAGLGLRGNPRFPGHDEAGWRNATRPTKATVVAIGDSQTYGSETSSDDAWPQLAQTFSGTPFYQIAIGGYGPMSYWRLTDEALALEPEQILVGLYDGNDFYDSWRDIYLRSRAPEWQDPALRDELLELEASGEPLHSDWEATRLARKAPGKARLLDALAFLNAHLALYNLVEGSVATLLGPPPAPESRVRDDFEDYLARAARSEPGLLEPFEDGLRSTIFTPRGRLQTMQLTDPRVREALRLTLDLIADIQKKCAGKTQLGFVLIPTKELVYADRVRERAVALDPSYERLIEAETALRERVMSHLAARGIPWVDTLPELRASLAAGRPPYGMNWNGHPNPEGNASIARAALSLVASMRAGSS